jgi:hypothetical protein
VTLAGLLLDLPPMPDMPDIPEQPARRAVLKTAMLKSFMEFSRRGY